MNSSMGSNQIKNLHITRTTKEQEQRLRDSSLKSQLLKSSRISTSLYIKQKYSNLFCCKASRNYVKMDCKKW